MNLYDQQTISGLGKSADKKDRRIRALKGVITKQKKKILFMETLLKEFNTDWKKLIINKE